MKKLKALPKKEVTLRELEELVPISIKTFEFNRKNVYVIIVNKPKIIMSSYAERQGHAIKLQDKLKEHGVDSILFTLDDENEIKILEMKG